MGAHGFLFLDRKGSDFLVCNGLGCFCRQAIGWCLLVSPGVK